MISYQMYTSPSALDWSLLTTKCMNYVIIQRETYQRILHWNDKCDKLNTSYWNTWNLWVKYYELRPHFSQPISAVLHQELITSFHEDEALVVLFYTTLMSARCRPSEIYLWLPLLDRHLICLGPTEWICYPTVTWRHLGHDLMGSVSLKRCWRVWILGQWPVG